jgi:cytochrome P450
VSRSTRAAPGESVDLVYDPTDPSVRRDPHPLFARLRQEDPVHWSPRLSGWVVTRYDLGLEVLSGPPRLYSADRVSPFHVRMPEPERSVASEIMRWLSLWLVFRDPPDHTRIRRHLNQVLNVGVVESMRGQIASIAATLLDRVAPGDAFDFRSDFSLQLPGLVVLDLLGAPREHLAEVKEWSDDLMLFIGSSRDVDDKYERARRGARSMAALFRELIADRRREPRDDALTKLMNSEINGESLTQDDLIASMMAVLNGGHETTANLLNNALLALVAHPDVAGALRKDPALMPSAVEEFLRYDSPVLSTARFLKGDTELGGRQLKAGDRIFVMLVSANRDPDVFPEPDRLDIGRSPNPHMAFSKGPHFCLGAPLSRVEAEIAFDAILERYKTVEIVEPVETIPWNNSLVSRGPQYLPVRLR